MFGAERKTPDFGAGLFSVSFKENGFACGEDSDSCHFKEYASAVVA